MLRKEDVPSPGGPPPAEGLAPPTPPGNSPRWSRARRFGVLLCLALLAVLTGSPEAAPGNADARPRCEGPAIPLPAVCGSELRSPEISCRVPERVEGDLAQASFIERQRAADLFSWQTLIGLDWPAVPGRRGVPAVDEPLGTPGPRVWETWMETSDVFRQEGGKPVPPLPWDAPPPPLPAACGDASKLLLRDLKVDDFLDAAVQPTFATDVFPGTLTDQRGRRVRYEIRMNRVAVEYVRQSKLWDGTVQTTADSVAFPLGSRLVKAAWMEIPGDQADRFVTAEACVCDGEPGRDGGLRDCRVGPVGLVGFHVMAKVPGAPQWVWSTFEHVANLEPAAGLPASFHDPACESCAPNRQGPAGFANQITREVPIPGREPDCSRPDRAADDVVRLNRDVRAALEATGSPLRFYELVGTQWPYPAPSRVPTAVASHEPATVFEVEPPLLGNSTLETYIQRSSSCMGCHALAATQRTDRYVSADFSFVLNNAWPHPLADATSPPPDRVPRDPAAIPPPHRPRTAWDREHWNDVVAGHELTVRTWELLPDLVTARLHCGSCHLGAGGDPTAAWWVGMRYKYDWPATHQLEQRINGCFERSMNGKAPCDPSVGSGPGSCAENPVMRGLITYMGWLDEQWRRAEPTGFPANGYPPLAPRQGDPVRGASVYLQKCAFCHGADGQGRYQYDTYYRPALWGPHSFNAAAGMGKPTTLAAFVHANMPYGYGGSLTPQEAWDVACYVDAQTRPGHTSPTDGGIPRKPGAAPQVDHADNGGAEPEAGGGCGTGEGDR